MSHFLVFYSRQPSVETVVQEYADPEDAVRHLLYAERELGGDPSRGVVMLVADSEEDLRRTHSHYFASIEELLRQPVA